MANGTAAMTPPPDVEAAVPSVPKTRGEKVWGAIGSRASAVADAASGLSGARPSHSFDESSVGKALNQHYQERLAQARRHYENAQTYGNILADESLGTDPQTGEPLGKDPQTGKPLTLEQRAQYKQMAEGAWGDYQKIAGTSKEVKQQLQQKKGMFDILVNKGHKALAALVGAHKDATGAGGGGGGAQGAQGGGSGSQAMSPPPSADAPAGGDTDSMPGAGGGMTPPPVAPAYNPQSAAQAPALRQQIADNRVFEQDKRKAEMLSKLKIEQEEAAAKAKAEHPSNLHLQHVDVTDPNSGETLKASYNPSDGKYYDQDGNVIQGARLAPKSFNYTGSDGTALKGWMIGNKLYDQDMHPLPVGTKVFSAWMQPLTTTTESYRSETQPDGSTKLIPVETTSTRVRGGLTPPPPPEAGGAKSKPAAGGGGAKIKGPGVTVGGKVPTGVSKAYDTYSGSIERYNVMTKALEPALHGDQQAMINILANHMGMTMGLQKGARMNQALIDEAQRSTPWLQGMKARFDDRGYLTGVTLTPEQMHQMIDLAKVRLDEDKEAHQREIKAAKTGYGMAPPPEPKKSKTAGGPPPKTAAEYLDSIGVH